MGVLDFGCFGVPGVRSFRFRVSGFGVGVLGFQEVSIIRIAYRVSKGGSTGASIISSGFIEPYVRVFLCVFVL